MLCYYESFRGLSTREPASVTFDHEQGGDNLRHELELSLYCGLGDKLIGKCAKDCYGPDEEQVDSGRVPR